MNRRPNRAASAQSFIHEQQVGPGFDGQRDGFRLAAIELAFEGHYDVGIADVSTNDPVERPDFRRTRAMEALDRDFVMDGPGDGYGAVEVVQQFEASDRGEADQRRRVADDDHSRPSSFKVLRSCSKSATS